MTRETQRETWEVPKSRVLSVFFLGRSDFWMDGSDFWITHKFSNGVLWCRAQLLESSSHNTPMDHNNKQITAAAAAKAIRKKSWSVVSPNQKDFKTRGSNLHIIVEAACDRDQWELQTCKTIQSQ